MSLPAHNAGTARKWRWILGYWTLQALTLCVLWPVLFTESIGGLSDLGGTLIDPENILPASVLVILVTAGQAAFVLPVRRPRVRGPGARVPWFHHVLSGCAIASAAGLTTAGLLLGLGTFDPVGEFDESRIAWISWSVFFLVWIIGSFVLIRRCREGTPVLTSVVIASVTSAVLLAGLAFAVLEGFELAIRDDTADHAWGIALLGSLLAGWCVGTPLLVAFMKRGPRETQLSRIASTIFLGTIIEAVAIIPLDVMVRRRTNCYCAEGTYWALGFCGSAGLLFLGPAIYLLPLGRRRKRLSEGRCEACGYDMRGKPDADRCPECGAGWRPAT